MISLFRHVSATLCLAAIAASLMPLSAQQPGTSPVKIFIMAGQSNTQGHGQLTPATSPGTLEYITNPVNDPEGKYQFLKNGASWASRNDVWIHYQRNVPLGSGVRKGDLTAGYGANSGNVTIGPELGFGTVIGNTNENQVLLIKTCWGGKTLGKDFLPPSSESYPEPMVEGDKGFFYKRLLEIVNDVTSNLAANFPGYNGQGYEIAGFAWHQGWNDRVTPAFSDAYEVNMANFINDIRADLGVPNLPFVIATTGMDGRRGYGYTKVELAQLKMADTITYPAFAGNVAVIDARDSYEDLDFWQAVQFSPSAVQEYHWNRNAKTYLHIGLAMGDAMSLIAPGRTPYRPRASMAPGGTTLSWKNGTEIPTSVRILRNGVQIAATAPANPPTFFDATAALGTNTYELQFTMPVSPAAPLTLSHNTGITNLQALVRKNGMKLVWQNNFSYSAIQVRRNGTLIAGALPGEAVSFTDTSPPTGPVTYSVQPADPGSTPAEAVVTVSSAPRGNATIYEPFDMPVGLLAGLHTGVGMDLPWNGDPNMQVNTGSLGFSTLSTFGNSMWRSTSKGSANVFLGDILHDAGLMNPSAELWFSFLTPNPNNVNINTGFMLGNESLSTNDTVSLSGNGIGVRILSGKDVKGAIFNNGSLAASSATQSTIAASEVGLIVGRIQWGAAGQPSTISVYTPGANLALDTPQSISATLDPSTFRVLSMYGNGNAPNIDEIRFGAAYEDVIGEGVDTSGDFTPPSPATMSFAVPPTAVSETEITMTATTATDENGVQYRFHNTTLGTFSSWQDSPTFNDTGLQSGTSYSYTAQARDRSVNANTNTTSPQASTSTLFPDTNPPPVPGFATPPTGVAASAITMAATTVIDPEGAGVQYRFHNTTLGTHSGWQAGTTWTDTDLTSDTTYSYTVQARDTAPALNESAQSAPQSGTTLGTSTGSSNATWAVDANGTWTTDSNWNPATAPGSTVGTTNANIATFGTIITADRAITVDINRNISGIDFAANSFAYNLSGGNLLLSNGGSVKTSGAGTAHTDTISTPIAIQSNAGTAVFTGGSSTATRLLVIGSDVTGVSTATNITNLTLNGSNTGNNAITGIIGDGSSGGKLAIVKSGSGLWRLSNANTFSGGLTLGGGTLTLATLTDSLGASGSSITVTANSTLGFAGAGDRLIEKSLLVNDGFTLTTSADTALTKHTFTGIVSGNGTIKPSGAGGAIFNRPIILSNAANTFTGPIELSATGSTISVASIGDTVGSGTIIMNTSGGQGSAFQLDATAVAALTLTNRVFSIRGTQPGMINNSNTTAANTLTINANLAATAGADRRLQLGGGNSGNNTFAGLISNSSATSIGLIKADGGKWIVSNANTYTGTTTINGGTLSISSIGNVNGGASALGAPVTLTNGRILIGSGNVTGTLLYTGSAASTDRTIQINNSDNTNTGGATITNNGSELTFTAPIFNNAYTAGTNTRRLTLGGDNGGTIQGIIQNNSATGLVGVTKSGEGTWILAGGNTYTGTTVIDAGTLLISGDSSLATGAVSVNNTSTLGGSGTLRGNVTVAAGANLAPSTLTLGGNLTISAMAGGAGQLIYKLGSIASSDRIAVTGTLNIGTGLLGLTDFDFTTFDELQNGTYTLITSGSLTGSLNPADVNDVGTIFPGATLQLQTSGNNIVLVVSGLSTATPYETWATSGELFEDDANKDGVSNGLAFLVGAGSPGDNALGLLPKASENTGGLVLTFQMRNASARGTASLQLEYSTNLATGSWTTVAVPDTSTTVGDIVFTITGTGPLGVTATIPASKAANGKLFSRLRGVNP